VFDFSDIFSPQKNIASSSTAGIGEIWQALFIDLGGVTHDCTRGRSEAAD
jgi:uncharacterized protein YfiM (DUF2279 family)